MISHQKKRMFSLFADDGRSLIVAMDHGAGADVFPGLADPAAVLDAVVAGGADAVLTTPGVLTRFAGHLKSTATILRVDNGSTSLRPGKEPPRVSTSVETALRLGADAVACMGFPGTEWEAITLRNLATLAGQCHDWGVPLMAEMLPGGFNDTAQHTVENIRLAARIGVELGADLIKTKFVGSVEDFRQVVAHSYQPVLVLGGSKTSDLHDLFLMVRNALDAGAKGAVIGRNVWGHPQPHKIVRALHQMIHANVSVEQALDMLAGDVVSVPRRTRIKGTES